MTALDYRQLAETHRPRDESTMRMAVQELASQGLTLRDIGAALGLDPAAVHRLMLGERVA